jgi:hypothetical protein
MCFDLATSILQIQTLQTTYVAQYIQSASKVNRKYSGHHFDANRTSRYSAFKILSQRFGLRIERGGYNFCNPTK